MELISRSEVQALMGVSRPTLWRRLADPRFPRPLKSKGDQRRLLWKKAEILRYMKPERVKT